jgi:hypothetical protein
MALAPEFDELRNHVLRPKTGETIWPYLVRKANRKGLGSERLFNRHGRLWYVVLAFGSLDVVLDLRAPRRIDPRTLSDDVGRTRWRLVDSPTFWADTSFLELMIPARIPVVMNVTVHHRTASVRNRMITIDTSSLSMVLDDPDLARRFMKRISDAGFEVLVPNDVRGELFAAPIEHASRRVRALVELCEALRGRVRFVRGVQEVVREEIRGNVTTLPELPPEVVEVLASSEPEAFAEVAAEDRDGVGEVKRIFHDLIARIRSDVESGELAVTNEAAEQIVGWITTMRSPDLLTPAISPFVSAFSSWTGVPAETIAERLPQMPATRALADVGTRQAFADGLPATMGDRVAPFRTRLGQGKGDGDMVDNAIIAVAARSSALIVDDGRVHRKVAAMRRLGATELQTIPLRRFVENGLG